MKPQKDTLREAPWNYVELLKEIERPWALVGGLVFAHEPNSTEDCKLSIKRMAPHKVVLSTKEAEEAAAAMDMSCSGKIDWTEFMAVCIPLDNKDCTEGRHTYHHSLEDFSLASSSRSNASKQSL